MAKQTKSKKTKMLVTGGAGFIGSHLVDVLIEEGNDVVVVDNLSTGKKSQVNKKAKFIEADIRDLRKIKPYFKNVDTVFHLGAIARIQPSIKNPIPSMECNVIGTLNVLLAARDMKVGRVVYSASSSSYGDQDTLPLHEEMSSRFKSPYALTKYVGEEICRLFSNLYGVETVSLRYFNVYGPRQLTTGAYATVAGIFLKQKKEGKPLTIVGDGTIRRDFTNVFDVVRANILASTSKKVGKGEMINIGTGRNHSINEVAALILSKETSPKKLGNILEEAVKVKTAIYIP
ncbi:MAG: NAD-dependent epimerase/dehydratase family protein, partial [Candidatus Paceibacterota bacterium]